MASGAGSSQDKNTPDLITAPLRQAGWQRLPETPAGLPPSELLGFVSPDGLATVRQPSIQQGEEPGLHGRTAWEITAGPPGADWTAAFSSAMPDHLLATATRWLASPRPVFRDQRDLAPESLEHLRVVSRSTPSGDGEHRRPQR
ncbi:DUF317 domain-containing protein [Streptomyces kaniharaensis]|uniref:DUF317 domain-containing protein n=1 Tax=Streptomyces kaniharaensis TaxID=212423 RepID=A0A6N7KTI6_9ACTN|nr:DUF317 domain-containing protein [Streptomyces kaniharaensis]